MSALALGTIPAFADSIVTGTFSDPVSWSNAATADDEITFDGVAPLGSYTTYGAGGYSDDGVTFIGSNGAGFLEQIADSGFQSPYNNWGAGGTLTSAQYLTVGNTPYIQVVLPAATTAFSVDLGSLSPNAMSVQVLLSDGESFTVPTNSRPNLTFFGVTTNAAVSYVDFSLVGADPDNGSQLAMDNFSLGTADQTATPEAGTLGLIGLGLVSLTAVRRRQNTKAVPRF